MARNSLDTTGLPHIINKPCTLYYQMIMKEMMGAGKDKLVHVIGYSDSNNGQIYHCIPIDPKDCTQLYLPNIKKIYENTHRIFELLYL